MTDREKQIEEMAKDMCGNTDTRKKDLCSYCVGWSDCLASAEALYNAGYRKQGDTAKEILQKLYNETGYFSIQYIIKELAEKYGVEVEE